MKKLSTNFKIKIVTVIVALLIVFANFSLSLPIIDNPNQYSGDAKYNVLKSSSSADNFEYSWDLSWGGIYDDYGQEVATDSQNMVYLVGSTDLTGSDNCDIIISKYDVNGQEEWVKTWGGSNDDKGYDIYIDASDNVYIIGITKSLGDTNGDLIIIKYDILGNEIWNKTWGGNQYELGLYIVEDAFGNFYVAGQTKSFGDLDGDICLIKYDNIFEEQWNVTWGGNEPDIAYKVGIDSNNYIYVVGHSDSVDSHAGYSDVVLLKYDQDGNYQWERTWGTSYDQRGMGLALDSNDNIYITGYSFGHPASSGKGFLLKYDSSGTYQWERIWGVNGQYGNYFYRIIIDNKDDLYISGCTKTYGIPDNYDALLLNYDTSGNQNWYKIWSGSGFDATPGICMDSQSNIYISGYSDTDSAGGYDALLIKYKNTLSLEITIHSPDFDDFYGSSAPTYWVTINGEYDAVWYTLDNGVTNITASGLNEIIDQTEWDKVADGIVNLRFYLNNSLGNLAYSDVNFTKDTVAPIITINSPIDYEKFGKISPSYYISIVEPYLDTMWYTIDGGVTNISADLPLIIPLTGTIDQIEWDKLGNGTVSIDFYADDESMNVGFAQVIIEKEATPPIITIISPSENYLFYTITPTFEVAIQEIDLNTTWYTLDDGLTNYIFTGLTGSIDQTEWDKYGNGTVTIKFYANDTYGYENFTQVTIRKDITPPTILINSPTPGAAFSAVAPAYDITVIDFQLDSMWYTIDGGITNISMSSSTGTIDQTEWDKKGEENVIIRFYGNDTLGNTEYSEVTIARDTITPAISINSPDPLELFGVLSPSYDLSIVESNLDSIWYTLDGGGTNITTSSLSGTIDQTEWNKLGNGTVTIQFYASDLAGHINTSQVLVLKDIIAPIITINSPNTADLFSNNVPSFSITIVESSLDSMWYTLDGGITNVSLSSLSGTIDQTEWDKLGNGTVTVQFYASDFAGNDGTSQILVYKDISAPVIFVNSPNTDEIFSSAAPTFDITVIDNQLDSMWYSIDGGVTLIPIVSTSGTIDQTEWDKNAGGNVYIRFYANDTLGNSGYLQERVIKDVLYGIDPVDLLTPSTFSELYGNFLNFSWTSLDLGFGAVNFTLQISNTSNFGHIVFQSEDITETPIVTNYSVPLSITTGQYYWRVQFTYKNYNGSWSDYFLFTFYINNYSPNLALEECTPTTGTRYTIFKITAIYYDLDNNAPFYIKILLNGISYFMEKVSPSDTDYINGCIYQYLTLLTPSTTAYTISFECSDGAFQYSTSTYQGPLVEPDSTPSTNQGEENLNSANTFAITMTFGITIGILIPPVAFAEKKVRKMKLGENFQRKSKRKK